MRQVVMLAPGEIEMREVDKPVLINPDEILLRIEKIGICGSDIHVYYGQHPATPYPVVQGHEYSATVVEVGEKVTVVKPGMKATARPQLVCGKCAPCRRGQYNVCQELKVQGFQAWGCAQDYFIVSEDRIVPLPDNMSYEHGAMIEPCAVGAHATNRVPDIRSKNVVVSGAGTIGNLVAQFAKSRGAKKVMIADLSSYRLGIAKACGVDYALDLNKMSFEDGVKDCFREEGFQVGFEVAGVEASLTNIISNIEKGGSVVIVGVYGKNPVVNMFHVGEHELNLYGTMMYRHEDYLLAVEMISTGKIHLNPLISKEFSLEQYNEAYLYIENNRETSMKVMIDLNPNRDAC